MRTTNENGIETVDVMERVASDQAECRYCTALIKRSTKHGTCKNCREMWEAEFGSNWYEQSFHRDTDDLYKTMWNGSGRHALDKTGYVALVNLSDETEISNDERIAETFVGGPRFDRHRDAYNAIRREIIKAVALGQKVPAQYKMSTILKRDYGITGASLPGTTAIESYIANIKAALQSEADFDDWAGKYRIVNNTLVRTDFDDGTEIMTVVARQTIKEDRKAA